MKRGVGVTENGGIRCHWQWITFRLGVVDSAAPSGLGELIRQLNGFSMSQIYWLKCHFLIKK